MLNKKSQALLSELSQISTAAVLKFPVTGIKDPSKSMIAFFDFREFGETDFEDYGIFNLPEFLSVVNIVEDAKIDELDGVINIANKNMSIKYYTTNIDLIEETYSADPRILDNIDKATKIGSIQLDLDTLDKLKKTSGLMKLNDLKVKGDGSKITLEITDNSIKSSNNFKIGVEDSTTDTDFDIVLKMDLIKKLPSSKYEVTIVQNPKTQSFITLFSSLDIPSLEIVILVVTEE